MPTGAISEVVTTGAVSSTVTGNEVVLTLPALSSAVSDHVVAPSTSGSSASTSALR